MDLSIPIEKLRRNLAAPAEHQSFLPKEKSFERIGTTGGARTRIEGHLRAASFALQDKTAILLLRHTVVAHLKGF